MYNISKGVVSIFLKGSVMKRSENINQIKKILLKMPQEKIIEIEDFVEFIWEKTSQGITKKKIKKLEGIWSGLGFENLDIEQSIDTIRQESEETLLKRSNRWNI